MNSLTKKIIIIVIAVGIIVPAIYFSLQLNGQNAEKNNPLYYIPSSSDGIGYANLNGTHMYFFEKNGSLAAVVSSQSNSFPITSSGRSNSTASLKSMTNNLSIVSTYKGIDVYKESNISINLAGFRLKNITIYFAYVNSFIIMGQKAAVMYSIDAYSSSLNAVSKYNGYINTSSNLSLFFNFNKTSPVSSLSLNYSYNTSYITMTFNNRTFEKAIITLAGLNNNIQILYLKGNIMKLELNGMNFSTLSKITGNEVL
ncbi:MAG: hypothetical protein ACP5UV_03545 [Thermoplasmata archaeon]